MRSLAEADGVDVTAIDVEGAAISGDQLFLTIVTGEDRLVVSGRMQPYNGTSGMDAAPRALVRLHPVEDASPQYEEAREIPQFGEERWKAIVRRVQTRVTPTERGKGAILDVLNEEELFLYYDDQDALRSVPIEFKPADVRPASVHSLSSVLSELSSEIAASLPASDRQRRYALFDTGDRRQDGLRFAVFDFKDKAACFARVIGAPEPAPAGTSAAPGLITHTLKSHLGSMGKRPVPTLGLLFTSVVTVPADTLAPKPTWALNWKPLPPLNDGRGMDLVEWESHLDAMVGGDVSSGKLDYLVDGKAFFPDLIDAISRARESIRLRLYIFDNDDYALKIADLLKRRSQEIDVQILLDGLGTIGTVSAEPAYTPDYSPEGPTSIVRYLRHDSDIQVRMIDNPWLQGDHTKAVIVDDDLAYTGGMNIGREYRYEWHDLMVRLRGPVVARLASDFDEAWRRAGPPGSLLVKKTGTTPGDTGVIADGHSIRLLYTEPGRPQILRAQIEAIRRARQRIYIQNAYFSSDAILYELAKARRRGVDVRLILPVQSDFGIMSRSNAVAANLMLKNGVRVYIYPGMSHVKAAIYDGWACLGSANFDRLSLRINREMNLGFSNEDTVNRLVEAVFEPDFQRSVELTEPLPLKWSDRLMELIADQL